MRIRSARLARSAALPLTLTALLSLPLAASHAETATAEPAAIAATDGTAKAPKPDADAAAAIAVVDQLHANFIAVMKKADTIGYQGRVTELRGAVTTAFDLDFMAEKSVGRHWKKLTADEQAQWIAAFHEMTAATYADRFVAFSGQSFEVLGQEPASHDTLVVRARLNDPGDDDVALNYRLHKSGDTWRIIDVYLNGTVSELALRRSEYSSVLKRDGFAKLIETIDGKTQQIAAGAVN